MTECYISVDCECTGLIVGEDNIASIGACVVGNTQDNFYIELKPFTDKFRPKSVEVCKLSIDYLKENGVDIKEGMSRFEKWVRKHQSPVFVGYPLVFDRAFIHNYFQRFFGYDPFGKTSNGIDIKTFAMAVLGIDYHETIKRKLRDYIKWEGNHSHNSLDDAKEQASLFERLREIQNHMKEGRSNHDDR